MGCVFMSQVIIQLVFFDSTGPAACDLCSIGDRTLVFAAVNGSVLALVDISALLSYKVDQDMPAHFGQRHHRPDEALLGIIEFELYSL